MSTCTVEEVASSCKAIRFFQLYVLMLLQLLLWIFIFFFCWTAVSLYPLGFAIPLARTEFMTILLSFREQVYKRRDITANLVQRAERCGYKAIVLTVDTPRLGRREADIKNKWHSASFLSFRFMLTDWYKYFICCWIGHIVENINSLIHTFNNKLKFMHFIRKFSYFCRMVAPQLKNFKGLISTKVSSVSEKILSIIIAKYTRMQCLAITNLLERNVHRCLFPCSEKIRIYCLLCSLQYTLCKKIIIGLVIWGYITHG